MPEAADFARERLQLMAQGLEAVGGILAAKKLCVYATGSFGRLEASEYSDIDLFFLHDAEASFSTIDLVRVMARIADAADELGFPPFSGEGKYLTVQSVSRVEEVLGSPDDDQLNIFTARLLLLLESQPVSDESLYVELLERVVGFYYRDFPKHAEEFTPTFLLNDILRFWRTLTLNYEHHRLKLRSLTGEELESKKADSALKNYKLKISRLTTCFSLAAHLGAAEPPVTQERVLELCRHTPWGRLDELRRYGSSADNIIDDLRTRYDQFLKITQRSDGEALATFADSEARAELLNDARVYGDRIFELLRVVTPTERFRFFVV